MDLTVDNILAHINTVFVLRTKVDKYASSVSGLSGAKSLSLSSESGSKGESDGGSQQDQRRPPSPTTEHSK